MNDTYLKVVIFGAVLLKTGSLLWSILLSILIHFIFGGHRSVIDTGFTFKRDIHATIMLIRQKLMYRFYDSKNMCIPLLWEKTVSKFPRRIAIIDAKTDQKWTFDEVNQFSNAIFNILKKYGATKGDTVSIIMPNCVHYGLVL